MLIISYDNFKEFADDMLLKYNIPKERVLSDISSVLSDGYSLDGAVDDLVAVYEKEFSISIAKSEDEK